MQPRLGSTRHPGARSRGQPRAGVIKGGGYGTEGILRVGWAKMGSADPKSLPRSPGRQPEMQESIGHPHGYPTPGGTSVGLSGADPLPHPSSRSPHPSSQPQRRWGNHEPAPCLSFSFCAVWTCHILELSSLVFSSLC